MVRFTDHAKDQMAQRGITEGEAMSVLSSPIETVRTRANRLASYARIEGKYIVVIHEHEDDEELVVTVMKVYHTRLARFGFAKV